MSTIRIVIADDDPRLRESLRLLVDSEAGMTVTGVAANGAQALTTVAEQHPDVVLMDVRMPVLGGLDATRRLCAEPPGGPRVIVLTMFDVDRYVYEALRAGASGFLLKNAPPSELLHAIRVVRQGNALLAPEVTRRLIGRLAPSPRSVDPRLAALTERERETLTLVGRGHSNAEIAEQLVVTPTTVRTYLSRILTKLAARDRAQLVVIAYETGLVVVDPT